MILDVRSGKLTVTEAAKKLGVSRRTYYKRETRALAGMMEGLKDKPAGRPKPKKDTEKEKLKQQLEDMHQEIEVLKQTLKIKETLQPVKETAPKEPKKRKRRRRSPRQGQLPLGGTEKRPKPEEPEMRQAGWEKKE